MTVAVDPPVVEDVPDLLRPLVVHRAAAGVGEVD
jgi:hypothetical protein